MNKPQTGRALVRKPEDAIDQLQAHAKGVGCTTVLLLDGQYALIDAEGIDGSGNDLLDAIASAAFRNKASAVIVGHHTDASVVAAPTADECRTFLALSRRLSDIDVILVDDITIGSDTHRSLLASGALAMLSSRKVLH